MSITMFCRTLMILLLAVIPSVRPISIHARQESPQLIAIFSHDDDIVGIQPSQDGERILSWSYDRTARLWDVTEGLLATMPHPDTVVIAEQNNDETAILTLSVDTTSVRIWSTEGELISTLDHDTRVDGAQWSKDSTRILTQSANIVGIWTKEGTQLLSLTHDAPVMMAYWNEDETRLLTGTVNGMVYLWDTRGTPIAKLDLSETASEPNGISSVKWSPDGNYILLHTRNEATIWNESEQTVTSISHHDAIGATSRSMGGAIWHPNSQEILTWSFDNTVRIWDIKGNVLATMRHDDWVVDAIWSSDGNRVLSWSADSTLRLWSKTGQELALMHHDRFDPTISRDPSMPLHRVYSAQWNADNALIVSRSNDDPLCQGEQCVYAAWIWTTQGELVAKLPHDNVVNGAIWNKSGTQILTWSEDGTAKIWSNQGDLLLTIPREGYRGAGIRSAAWNDNETQILTWLIGHTIQIWDIGE